MKRQARKARRARRTSSELDNYTPLARLALIAGESLALNDEQLSDAMNALSGYGEPGELADVLHARLLELVELLGGLPEFAGVQVAAERARLEQRRGAGFVQRVSRMGTPAAAALSSHKIQSGQLLARARALLKNVTRWSALRGGWLRQCTRGSRRRSSSGRGVARTSSRRVASKRRSSSASITRRSTPTSSSESESPSTQSDEPAEWSSARRTHRARPSLCCASSIVDTDSRAGGQ